MFEKLKKLPYWYLIAIPLFATLLGAASNQAVLIANGDRFPVLYNNEKIHASCQTPEPNAGKDFLTALLGGGRLKSVPSILEPQPAPKMADPDLCRNGGKFLDDTHVIMDKDSHLKILSDIFDMHEATYSVGDGLLEFGSWMWDWSGLAWLVLIVRKLIET